jgi:hypothetical protein
MIIIFYSNFVKLNTKQPHKIGRILNIIEILNATILTLKTNIYVQSKIQSNDLN